MWVCLPLRTGGSILTCMAHEKTDGTRGGLRHDSTSRTDIRGGPSASGDGIFNGIFYRSHQVTMLFPREGRGFARLGGARGMERGNVLIFGERDRWFDFVKAMAKTMKMEQEKTVEVVNEG